LRIILYNQLEFFGPKISFALWDMLTFLNNKQLQNFENFNFSCNRVILTFTLKIDAKKTDTINFTLQYLLQFFEVLKMDMVFYLQKLTFHFFE